MQGATDCRSGRPDSNRISIHAPHARCDNEFARECSKPLIISIHAPHARCDRQAHRWQYIKSISIHAPHARCDVSGAMAIVLYDISIHAPHARCDRNAPNFALLTVHFNPRTSCEVRLPPTAARHSPSVFQSTHLMRGATAFRRTWKLHWYTFQSTHLMRGATYSAL